MRWLFNFGHRRIMGKSFWWKCRYIDWILVDEDGVVVGETVGGSAYLMSPIQRIGRYVNGRRARIAVEDALSDRVAVRSG